ncbi:MAG: hypothetical protein JW963_21255 [Anaerolineales bacterium]|nr:hypothetical protein [Anaerolineales bacterium]
MRESKTTALRVYSDHLVFSAPYHRTGVNARAIPTKTAEAASPASSPVYRALYK